MSDDRLEELRTQIEALDRELVTLIGKRRELVIEVGRVPVQGAAQERLLAEEAERLMQATAPAGRRAAVRGA